MRAAVYGTVKLEQTVQRGCLQTQLLHGAQTVKQTQIISPPLPRRTPARFHLAHLVKIITLGMMALTAFSLTYSCKTGITFPNIATNGVKNIIYFFFFCQYVSMKQKLFCFQLLSCSCGSKMLLSCTTGKNFPWASEGR